MKSFRKLIQAILLFLVKIIRRKPVIAYAAVALLAFFLSQPRPKYDDFPVLSMTQVEPSKQKNHLVHYALIYVPEDEADLSVIVRTANIMENAVVHRRGLSFFRRAADSFGANLHEKVHLQIVLQWKGRSMTALGALIDVQEREEAVAFARELQTAMGDIPSVQAVEITQDIRNIEVEWMDSVTIITDKKNFEGRNTNEPIDGQHTMTFLGENRNRYKIVSTRVEATKLR
jgi:hypothetical protein